MPIVDVEVVVSPPGLLPADLAERLADALGEVFGAEPGHVWLRLRVLPQARYAENATMVGGAELPVFVDLLLADPPSGDARARQAAAVAVAVAQTCGRAAERVHIVYAPAAAGRIAFGGVLLT
ncbi:hypothetical protein BURK2_00102 [Burkholderiales bacterium]|nr:MAG: hypothetical protein F9K47_03010 [Burkholderiales bacterium]CAG0949424.1 hypothetical protein BURK2_00102 [Burkholderiales bacterium]